MHETSKSSGSTERVSKAGTRGFAWTVVAAVLLAVFHIAASNYFVPVDRVFVDEPLDGIDYDLHIGQVFRVVEALDKWGKTWSYDVQLVAGQPEGTITDSGSKGWELWTFAVTQLGVSRAIAFNLFILLVMWGGPVLIFLAARNFEFSVGASLLATAMCSLLWFFDSHLHWIWFVGMISWCGAACLAFLTLGYFLRWLRDRQPRHAVLSAVLLSVGLLVHPYTFFVLAVPMSVMSLRAGKTLRRVDFATIAAIVLLAIGTNAYWLHNALTHWHYILDSAVYAQAAPEYFVHDLFDILFSGSDTGLTGTRAGFRFLSFGLCAAGLALWYRRRDWRFLPITCTLFPLLLVSYLGGYMPGMQQTQPYRQITPAMLLSALPAAAFVSHVWTTRAIHRAPLAIRLAIVVLLGVCAQQLVTSQVLYFFPTAVPEPETSTPPARWHVSKNGFPWRTKHPSHPSYTVPHSDTMEFGARSVVRWLERNVSSGSRMLVEGAVLGERLAWRSGFEVLGGFFERNVEHVDANFFRGQRGKELNPSALEHHLRTFAVDWVVKDHADFESLTHLLEPVASVAGRRIYRTKVGANRVLSGGGRVRASSNRIEVTASSPDQPVLLSYHWHPALRCTPHCRVERAAIDIDRVGFVRVPAPHPANLVVFNSYTW